MHHVLRMSCLTAGFGLAVACGGAGDSGASSSTPATHGSSGEAGTEAEQSSGGGSSTESPSSTEPPAGSDTTSGADTTGSPAPSCGGECLADVVASAYSTCETDVGRDFPCEATGGCERAVARCDATRENCTFGDADADAYIAAVTCILRGLREGEAGRYTIDYMQEPSSPNAGDEEDNIFSTDVQADSSAHTLSSFDLGGGDILLSLFDDDLACVQAGLAKIDPPADLMQALFVSNDIRVAFSGCQTLCFDVFEGIIEAPDGSCP